MICASALEQPEKIILKKAFEKCSSWTKVWSALDNRVLIFYLTIFFLLFPFLDYITILVFNFSFHLLRLLLLVKLSCINVANTITRYKRAQHFRWCRDFSPCGLKLCGLLSLFRFRSVCSCETNIWAGKDDVSLLYSCTI